MNIKGTDIDYMFCNKGWSKVSNRTILGKKEKITTGYIKEIIFSESYDELELQSQENIKNEVLKNMINSIFTSAYSIGTKYNYLNAQIVNDVFKTFDVKTTNISKTDIQHILKQLGFTENPISATINKKSAYIYKQTDHTHDYTKVNAWDTYLQK